MGVFGKHQDSPEPTKESRSYHPAPRVGNIVKVVDGHGYEEYFVVTSTCKQSISYEGFSKTYDSDKWLELIRIDEGCYRDGSIYAIELKQKIRDEAAGDGAADDAPDGE